MTLPVASTIRVKKLTPRIGAEILDVDVTRLTDADMEAIRTAWLENLVVFFRDQEMTPEQHAEFARRFGEVTIDPKARGLPVVPGHPEIAIVATDENSTSATGDTWHSDGASDPEPSMGSVLYMHQTPPDGGGDTLFANMYLAYDGLKADMKAFLDTLTAVNDFNHAVRQRYQEYGQAGKGAVSEHPVVRVHPETGRKCLFINRLYTSHIVQLDRPQSDGLLRSLFDHLEAPIFQCRFKWEPRSIAVWDNRCVQHYAIWDYFPHRRLGHRVNFAGARPAGIGGRTGRENWNG